MKRKLTLLFGMPRSGTTWLAKIFDSHPDTLYRHEPDSSGDLNRIPFYPDPRDADLYKRQIDTFVSALPSNTCLRVAGSLPIFRKNYCSGPRLLVHRCAVAFARAAETAGRHLPIPSLAMAGNGNAPHLVWKSVESLGRIGVLARALPKSRVLIILRHPCAYIASVLKGEETRHFGDTDLASEDYEIYEWLIAASSQRPNTPSLDDLKKLEPVERLAWRWVLSNEKALKDTAGIENCAYVRYEDVCTEPMATAWELLNFAGLQWHEQVMQFVQRSTSRDSVRYYSVFKDPLKAANKWQTEMSRNQIERVMAILRETPLGALYGNEAKKKPSKVGSCTVLDRLSVFG